ncbi:uncharacterized protein JCM15063_002670 [Sporobolomyces koalae]|uniref:uncharacterized protein n=1 Tax=Sporobolomyces koalae TaxID=500713 RepID=UPI00317A14D9
MPCLFRLPVNADTTLVALCRPFTFIVALGYALFAFAYSSFLNISGLAPIECRCPHADKTPRTRPRPVVPSPIPEPTPATPAPAALQNVPFSFSSFVESLRPRRPPPVARRGSHNKALPYPVHELDEVVEEEDGEETVDNSLPALTPDVSEGSEGEDESSVNTIDDAHAESDKPHRKGKSKKLHILTNLRWRRSGSVTSTSQDGSQSPSQQSLRLVAPDSAFTSEPQAHQSIATRPRAATASSGCRAVRFTPHRQSSLESISSSDSNHSLDGSGNKVSRKSVASGTSTQPRVLFSKSSLRSHSPLSRSPVSPPEPSPPASPGLPHSSFSQHFATRPLRSHSVDSQSIGPRGRRTTAEEKLPRLRRGVSIQEGPSIDSTGSSHLRLDDFLR